MSTPIHILIYRSGGIGDVILSTACLDLIENLPMESHVYWLGRSPSLELIQEAYPKIKCLEVKTNAGRICNMDDLRKAISHVDVAIDLQRSVRSWTTCWKLARPFGAKVFTWNKRSTYRSMLVMQARLRGRFSPIRNKFRSMQTRHAMMTDSAKRALKSILPNSLHGHLERSVLPRIPTKFLRSDYSIDRSTTKNWLGVGTGALFSGKEAPAEIFFSILLQIQKYSDCGLIFVGDAAAKNSTKDVMNQIGSKFPCIDLVGKTSLIDVASVLANCSALLTNDTALAHLAEAVGTPVGTLFGPTVEAFGYTPFLPRSQAFSTTLGCRPCTKDGDAKCRYGDQACFYSIDAASVAKFLSRQLNG